MFEFVADRPNSAKQSAGPFAGLADQSRFVTAWGKIDGEGHFTNAHELASGIYSADGRAKLTAIEYRDANDRPHDIRHNKATLREFMFRKEDVIAWNAYEAAQSNRKEDEFRQAHEAKMRGFGLQPQKSDITDEYIAVDVPPPPQSASPSTVSMHVPAKRRGRPRKNAQPVS